MTSLKEVIVIAAFGLLIAGGQAQAATYTAASCSQSAVQTAINQHLANAQDGDMIVIPAGSCMWTGTTIVSANFTKSVTIQGAGAISSTDRGAGTSGSDQTVIIDNLNRPSTTIDLSIAAGKTLRITGIAITQNSASLAVNNGILNVGGSGVFRMDHCHQYLTKQTIGTWIGGALTGVIDHNYFEAAPGLLTNDIGFHNGANWNGDTAGYGDKSWADADHWGTSQFIFTEDNRFFNGDPSDSSTGGRFVFRYNTVTVGSASGGGGQMFNHGLTPGRDRGMRAAELYQNTFAYPSTGNQPTFSVNAGSLLYWGNTITNYYPGAVYMDYQRFGDAYPGGWGNPPSGWGICTGTAGTVWDGAGGYPCMDAPARGAGDLLTGGTVSGALNNATGTKTWLRQVLSPMYIWGNTYSGVGTLIVNGAPSALIQQNRDYYQQTASFNGTAGIGEGLLSARPATCMAGPGGNTPGVGYWATDTNTLYVCTATNTWSLYYRPYTYPHPLQSGTIPPTDTTAPTVPGNLNASPVSSTQIDLSWTASTDNVGVTGYRMERCAGSACTNFVEIAAPTGTSHSNTGLTANTPYRFRVRAADAAGNVSGYSAIVPATTPAAPPGTITVSGCAQTDVQTAIAGAPRGATIVVGAGTCAWSNLSLPKGVTLKGAGIGSTVITGGNTKISVSPDATAIANEEMIKIEGFTFDGNNSALVFIWVEGAVASGTKPFKNLLIANNRFQNSSTTLSGNGTIYTRGQVRGLIHHNVFDRCEVVLKPMGNDWTTEWSSGNFPLSYGTADNLYFEDNTITYSIAYSGSTPGWIESGQGGRTVVRFNTWNYANANPTELWDIHGFQNWSGVANGGQTGTMVVEYYGNTASSFRGYRWINHRGSWGMFFDNTATGTGGMGIEINQYAPGDNGGSGCAEAISPAPNYRPEVNNTYVFNNLKNGALTGMGQGPIGDGCGTTQNNGYWNQQTSFNGTVGVGRGPLSGRPASCTVGVGYWATDAGEWNSVRAGADGQLYKCTAANTWTLFYTPYSYPHPLQGGATPPQDTTAPTVPGNLNASSVSSTQINLSWTASTDNVGVTGYRILRGGTQVGTSVTPSFSNTGLTPSTAYSYTVTAVDAAGNVSAPSAAASATTPAPPVTGAPWSGILDPSRAIDWAGAGVPGGIPNRTTICATINPGATTASIQTAMNTCAAGGVVFFAAGTYTLTASLTSNRGIVLRGAGPALTKLVLNGNIIFSPNPGSGWLGGYPPGTNSAVNWTGGYAKGSTVITLASTTGLSVGHEIMLDQLNDTSLVSLVGNAGTCGVDANGCGRNGLSFEKGTTRAQFQLVRIAAINGNSVTIDGPLNFTYKAALSPQAFFWSGNIRFAGVEDMTIDAQQNDFAVNFSWCTNCWMKNTRVQNMRRSGVYLSYAYHGEVRDSHFSGSSNAGPTNYGIEVTHSSAMRIENNTLINVTAPILLETSNGVVSGYNYASNTVEGWMFASIQPHLSHNYMNLMEGNIIDAIALDVVWGSGSHFTFFRNRVFGHHSAKNNNRTPIGIAAWNRYVNVVGNVLGVAGFHKRYEVNRTVTGGSDDFIYMVGYFKNWYDGLTNYDDLTPATLMRWGNFDAASNATRWNASEILPTGTLVPASQTLPASFYLPAKPAWFGSVVWPPIGPDVTGMSTKIPAQVCHETGQMPNCLAGTTPADTKPPSAPKGFRLP